MKEKAKRNSIGRRIGWGIVAFALVLVILVSVPVCYGFLVKTVRDDIHETSNYASIAANAINGDRALEYARTKQKDEYYEDTEAVLQAFLDDAELTRATVFIPYKNDVMFLWDTDDSDTGYDLGGRKACPSGKMGIIMSCFDNSTEDTMYLQKVPQGRDLIVAFAPVYDSQGQPAAVVSVQQVKPDLKAIIMQLLVVIVTVAAIASAIMMLIAYRILRKKMIQPIRVLTEGAEKMVSNLEREEPISIEVHTNDELETLAEAFTEMDVDMREYIKELSVVTAEKERISTELELASKIQAGMLPKLVSPFNDRKEYELFANMTPAKEVGGDFYDFFMVDDRHIALVMADVSGKGIPGALMMMVSKILIKNSVRSGKSPAEALRSANETMLEGSDTAPFVTVWLALIDIGTGRGVAANAGHEHPALRRADGSYELIKYKHSPAVGTVEGLQYKEHEFTLEPGDTLFVYTDGVTEATDSDLQSFGNDRLVEALNSNTDASPEELLQTVKAAIEAFAGDAPQFDDITMLAFRYNG